MPKNTNGHLITHNADGIVRHDYLYRISLKALIYNDAGQILVVKEIDRPFWDLPGGGMDYDETIESSLKRELHEEVGYQGDVRYQIFDASDQIYIERLDAYQICFYCRVWPENFDFAPGEEGDTLMICKALATTRPIGHMRCTRNGNNCIVPRLESVSRRGFWYNY